MNIFVVCAPQTFGCNTGMVSVDLAAWYFLKKNFPPAKVRFFTIYPPSCTISNLPFAYESPQSFLQQIKEAHVVLYWGDFLHAYNYYHAIVKQLMTKQGLSQVEALDLVDRFLYLKDQPIQYFKKVILYGGTILFNDWSCYQDSHYKENLIYLLKNCKAIWMREVVSANMVKYLRDDFSLSAYAGDCALFLDRQFFNSNKKASNATDRSGSIGVFFGRSYLEPLSVCEFLVTLSNSYNYSLEWVSWGKPPFFFDKYDEYRKCIKYFPNIALERGPLETLESLMNFKLIVSDTYHVCVNAWSLGVPAICIIDDQSTQLAVNSGDCRLDKREVFYWGFNLNAFIIKSSSLNKKSTMNNIVKNLNSDTSLILIFDYISKAKYGYSVGLLSALEDIIAME